jgi:hypothetical protein
VNDLATEFQGLADRKMKEINQAYELACRIKRPTSRRGSPDALQIGPLAELDQGEEPGRPGYGPGARRRLGEREMGMHELFRWFLQNRETGAITIAQAPNLFLWIAIVSAVLIWVGHPSERLGVALAILFKAALFFWAGDEVLRGINPWRRCLGIAVLCYGLWTLPR